jgi:hypothetical protein
MLQGLGYLHEIYMGRSPRHRIEMISMTLTGMKRHMRIIFVLWNGGKKASVHMMSELVPIVLTMGESVTPIEDFLSESPTSCT